MNLSEDEIRELNYKRFREKSPIVQKRLHAIYLKSVMRLSNSTIGQILSVHRNSVETWIHQYQKEGLTGLTVLHYRSPVSELEKYAAQIKSSFSESMIQTTKEFSHRIYELTGISRGLTQIRRFIKKLGFKHLQTGHIPAKCDNLKQKNWKETVLDIAVNEAEMGNCHLLFMDAAHFILEPFICKVWALTRKFVKAAAGRNRINVLGAVNAVTKQINTLINTTFIDACCVIEFLKLLRMEYGDKNIRIVLDNARYQHCKAVMDVANELNITLLFLPPYSPNLNIIERLWKFTKKKILYGKYYDSPAKFHEAILDFFVTVNSK